MQRTIYACDRCRKECNAIYQVEVGRDKRIPFVTATYDPPEKRTREVKDLCVQCITLLEEFMELH